MALKRIFWRKVKKTGIYRINPVKRADNLAMIKLLKIDLQHIREMEAEEYSRFAIVDSQPDHDPSLKKYRFDIIIDHHDVCPRSHAAFVDIKDEYGAVSTLLLEYLKALKIKPSPRLATALFYAIKTDTENFARPTTMEDIRAFRHLYPEVNTNIIKKIEASEMTTSSLDSFRQALNSYTIVKDRAFVHMGDVTDPDRLVMLADFFLKVAEANWSVVSGVYGQKLIVIFRHAGFRKDAGKTARDLFGKWGSAGGHRNAARAEVQIRDLDEEFQSEKGLKRFLKERFDLM